MHESDWLRMCVQFLQYQNNMHILMERKTGLFHNVIKLFQTVLEGCVLEVHFWRKGRVHSNKCVGSSKIVTVHKCFSHREKSALAQFRELSSDS